MDNPNHSTRIRRCNSLPSKIQRRSSLLPARLRLKRNPYVGSFRHSPPTSFRSMEAGLRQSSSQHFYFTSSPQEPMRNSPYIGWFRHAPPSSVRLHKVDHREIALSEKCQALALILTSLARKEKSRPEITGFVAGRLCGGGKDGYYVHRAYHDSPLSAEKGASTPNMLAKLGSWFLAPLAQDAEALYKTCYYDRDLKRLTQELRQVGDESDSESDSEDEPDEGNDDESIALSDFDGPVTTSSSSSVPETTSKSTSKPLDVSVSEIAEAYYAHQVIDHSEYSSLEGDRLDYVITQSDIARMARNAARHLDVESILNLPTTTYHSKRCLNRIPESTAADSRDQEAGWSFIMVPTSSSKSAEHPGHIDDTECVICLEAFQEGDRLRVLPCDHSFHVGCIDRWLSGSHSHHECFTSGCPTCKKRPSPAPVSSPTEQVLGNDGSVPSWAFAKLGSQMAQSLSE